MERITRMILDGPAPLRVVVTDEGMVMVEHADGRHWTTTIPLEQVPQCRHMLARYREAPAAGPAPLPPTPT
jgi:hypothetical protein